MRIMGLAALLLMIFYFVKIDLDTGTIPLASFQLEEAKACTQEKGTIQLDSISVQTLPGDTIYSLFALYPSEGKSFIERLSDFYTLNPHLQKQDFAYGETVQLPIYQSLGACK